MALISLVQAGVKQTPPPERRGQQPSLEVGLGLGSYPVPSSAHRPRTGSENHGDPGPNLVRQRRPPPVATGDSTGRAVARPPASGATVGRVTGFPLPSGLRRSGGPERQRSRQVRARHRPHRWRRSQRRAGVQPQGAPRPTSVRASHERSAQQQLAAQFTGRLSFRSRAAGLRTRRASQRAQGETRWPI